MSTTPGTYAVFPAARESIRQEEHCRISRADSETGPGQAMRREDAMGIESLEGIVRAVPARPDLKIGLREVFRNGSMSFNVGVVPEAVPDHYHAVSDEMYCVQAGQGRMRLGEEYTDVEPGDIITIPRGMVHGLVNTCAGDMIIFIITSPPFDPEHDRFTV
jgi:mannose-6-phosphate isomerase-like protein (cupin superfamily)